MLKDLLTEYSRYDIKIAKFKMIKRTGEYHGTCHRRGLY